MVSLYVENLVKNRLKWSKIASKPLVIRQFDNSTNGLDCQFRQGKLVV